ncbi:hypothetical protein SCACP_22380 [Sporomusa carbonis]|uniref:acyltransferase n=1 Tax=Sporomusa carbonis TaxID=3076075 RepID=UPI003A6B7CC4
MAKQHIIALDYIRGLAMLGVLGIHTGAYSLANPAVNPHLFALLEIFTRFSVPIFFFVSAFGLFISQPLNTQYNYKAFMSRRLKTVLLPYLAWSLLYMLHYTLASGDTSIWERPLVYEYFLFGLASYQLYFLVILVWFYALMPLWRKLVGWIVKTPLTSLLLLLMAQIAFNYYSSYELKPDFSNYYLNLAIQHRMNYLVLHYLFIFIFGAVCAELYPQFLAIVQKYSRLVNTTFVSTLIGMLFFYYYLVYFKHYSLEEAVNTIHQLSPIGVLYTAGATLFWFKTFSKRLPDWLSAVLGRLGACSYLVYLIHPIVMYYLVIQLNQASIPLTAPVVVAFYLSTLALSAGLAVITSKLSSYIPVVRLALTGVTSTQRTARQKAE